MKIYILLLALTGLVACSDSKPNSSAKDSMTLTSEKIVKMNALEPSQQKEIRAIMLGLRLVPDTFIYLVAADESAATKTSRAEKIRWLQGYDLQVHNSILALCDLKNPAQMIQADVEGIGASITGSSCPIQHEEFSTASANKFTTVVASPDLQSKTGLLSIAMTSTSETKATTHEISIRLTLTTSEGKFVKITTGRQSARHQISDKSYTEMNFEFPNARACVQVFNDGSRKIFFLNGKTSSAAEIKNLFGYDI